jgi:hypothetical protein
MNQSANYWDADLLGRRQDSEFLYNFLVGQTEKRKSQGRIASYVLNIDADWGGGKSFFLDGFAVDLQAKGHLVARINAWRDDHAVDPYVAIMAAIDKVFAPFVKKPGKVATAWASAKASGGPIALRVGAAIVKGLVKKHAGVSFEEIQDVISTDFSLPDDATEVLETAASETSDQLEKLFDASVEAMIEGFNRTDHAITDFRLKLETAVAAVSAKKQSPFFVLIDELDRCRPTYAVQLLERVKHLFDVEGVVFVFATNASQLQHSIAGAYGSNFDGMRYLKRFFDRTYVFENPAIEDYVASLCVKLPTIKLRAPEGDLKRVLTIGFQAYGFELRAIKQIMEMIDSAASAWPYPFPIDVLFLFPLCAHFYKTSKAEWPDRTTSDLKNWVSRRIRPGNERDHVTTISYVNGYGTALDLSQSIANIVKFSLDNGNQSPIQQYLKQTFLPEWNDRKYDEKRPSVQQELLGLVASAGKMHERKP